MKESQRIFLANCVNKLIESEVGVWLPQSKRLPLSGDSFCNGYFDDMRNSDHRPLLAVAIGKPVEEWFGTFIHEFCHFEQWWEHENGGLTAWSDCVIFSDNKEKDAIDLVFSWAKGEIELTDEQVFDYCRRQAACEHDCERRVLDKLKKNPELPINIEDYAKRANSYAAFYFTIPKYKKWYIIAPYESKAILDIMPSELLTLDECEGLAEQHMELFERECLLWN